eukprot:TRINITY_DN41643_c0_g1_i1.p1 TRINITY_DN41643_c0_g1~~TRINITY_DN41643_c0_g1_i1.p1  ORF type:complete len:106 (+),score=33.35 TRINITY_DN41643_c0_g1_i1:69-386(+)
MCIRDSITCMPHTLLPTEIGHHPSFKCASVCVTHGNQHALDELVEELGSAPSFMLVYAGDVEGLSSAARTCAADQRFCRLSLIHISEPTRLLSISYAVFCLKKKN